MALAVVIAITAYAAAPTPTDAGLTAYAVQELKDGKIKEAIGDLRARLKANPRDGTAAFMLGVAFNRLGRYDLAAQSFANYEKAGGKNPALGSEYGLSLLRTGHPAEAAARLEKVRATNPSDNRVAVILGLAYLGQKRFDQAEAVFRSVGADPKFKPASLLWLAATEKARNNNDAADKYLAELRKTAPDSPEVKLLDKASELAKSQKK